MTRRRRRRRAEWLELVQAWTESDEAVEDFCARHDISTARLMCWVREFSAADPEAGEGAAAYEMIELPLLTAGMSAVAGHTFTVHLSGGRRLSFDGCVDLAGLTSIARALEQR